MATVKIIKDLRNMKRMIPLIRKDYVNRLQVPLKLAIIKDILRGVSPVLGKKFPKYSKSYKASIRGKVMFFTVSGGGGAKKVIAIKAGRGETLPTLPHAMGKNLSPVNLKLSDQMLNSMKVRKLGFGASTKLEIIFEDEVAIFHNKLGAGKSKTIRRLLPTELNERFNRRISRLTITLLNRSVSRTLKKFNRQ